jgi:tRNA(Ile)-lysidine synthase
MDVMTFRASIVQTILDYSLWDFRSRLILAVSGGCDSMVMLDVMRFLAPDPMRQLAVVHVDHGVRHVSADDAAFVEQETAGAGIPFTSIRLRRSDPPRGISAEQHWRTERYRVLHTMRAQSGAVAIATAHTATDHLETVLMRLITGTGPRGFLGIRANRNDGIIRPLLRVTRDEVAGFAASTGIRWRDDSSNRDTSKPRNAIRTHVIPVLRHINPEADRNAVHSSTMLANEDTLLSNLAMDLLARSNWNRAMPVMLDAAVFGEAPESLVNRCAAALYDSIGSRDDYRVETSHIRALSYCLTGSRPFCPLPEGGRAWYKDGKILLVPGVCREDLFREIALPVTGSFRIGAYSITACGISDNQSTSAIPEGGGTIRTRRPGDTFRDRRRARTQRLSETFRLHRVPARIRPLLPLLIDQQGRAVWIPDPFRFSEICVPALKKRWIKLTCKPISAIR